MSPNGKLAKRPATLDDLIEIEALCRSVHFDIGFHNAKLYFETSPGGWQVCVDENTKKIVAASVMNQLPNGALYNWLTIVDESYRSSGVGGSFMPADLTSIPYMASSNSNSIVRAALGGLAWLEKRHGMYGFIRKAESQRLDIPRIHGCRFEMVDDDCAENSELVTKLLDYDKSICHLERREYVRKWSVKSKKHGRSVMALDETTGECIGYGTMRLFSDYYSIQPLYANSDEIATSLMIALIKWCLDGDVNLYLPLMASKKCVFQFCHDLGMVNVNTEFRNCSQPMMPYVRSLPIEKVYTVHEFYPV